MPIASNLTLDHVGIVVRDLDVAVEKCRWLGMGPFESPRYGVIERELYGRLIPVDAFKLKGKMTDLGSIKLELIQPLEGTSIWGDFLEARGEGIHHLGFTCDDIARETQRFVEKGYEAVFRSRYRSGGGAAYFDMGVGAFLIEIVQH